MENLFFDILQVAVGNRKELSRIPTSKEWQTVWDISMRQALLGVVWAAVDNLDLKQYIPRTITLNWLTILSKSQDNNDNAYKGSAKASKWFLEKGFKSCILKGQGNIRNYPDNLKDKRISGDIDIWVWKEGDRMRIRDIVEFCKKRGAGKVCYHHLEFHSIYDTVVEVHMRPSWFSAPHKNNKLQRWFEEQKKKIEIYNSNEDLPFPVPTTEFNVVYMLIHIFRHLFEEGIGLRQLLDYYFVIKAYWENGSKDKDEILGKINEFGLADFSGAVMHVMGQVFAMPEEMMICRPDVRRGQHLLNEIMIAGNFGKYDPRIKRFEKKCYSPWVNQIRHEWHTFKNKNIRSIKMIRLYPEEVIWKPYFMIYHWIWRKLRLWRWE